MIGGAALIVLAIIFWRPVQQRCLDYLLLRSDAPSEDVLSGAVEQSGNPRSLLTELWRTQRVPHRQFVLKYLDRISSSKPELFHAMEPVLLEAVHDPDVSVRELAFAALARERHPQLRALALEQLADADPAARLLGLQNLRSIASPNDVAIAMSLLQDPEPRVVVAAALVLRNATGQDFGIKSTDALPQFTCIDTNPPPTPDLPAIRQGVKRWQEWWTSHHAEFPAAPLTAGLSAPGRGLVTAEFTLEDLNGKSVRLSQFRGKEVLLAFWSPDAPASLDDVPALEELQRQNTDRLVVLGVSIAAASCDDDHDPLPHSHHHHDQSAAGMAGMPGMEHMHCAVQTAATNLKINFPMVQDSKGVVGPRFSIEDLPAYVLIDGDGVVRRRLVGFRAESALAALVKEAGSPSTVRASAK